MNTQRPNPNEVAEVQPGGIVRWQQWTFQSSALAPYEGQLVHIKNDGSGVLRVFNAWQDEMMRLSSGMQIATLTEANQIGGPK